MIQNDTQHRCCWLDGCKGIIVFETQTAVGFFWHIILYMYFPQSSCSCLLHWGTHHKCASFNLNGKTPQSDSDIIIWHYPGGFWPLDFGPSLLISNQQIHYLEKHHTSWLPESFNETQELLFLRLKSRFQMPSFLYLHIKGTGLVQKVLGPC